MKDIIETERYIRIRVQGRVKRKMVERRGGKKSVRGACPPEGTGGAQVTSLRGVELSAKKQAVLGAEEFTQASRGKKESLGF